MSPLGRYSCIAQGASPGLVIGTHLLSPFRGGTSCSSIGCGRYLSVGAFACLGKCRSYGAHFTFACVYPGFHIGLCPHFTLGYAGVSPLQGSFYFVCVYPGFHIGLRPHFTLGFAGVSPLQGSLSYWAFAVLCSLNVFGVCKWIVASVYLFDCDCMGCGGGLFVVLGIVCGIVFVALYLSVGAFACVGKCRPCRALCRIGRLRCCVVVLCSLNVFGCVNGLLRSFVYLFDCIVCGIDWCGRAMSPKGAILLYSPGRKPWVNYWNTFIEPL